jgi:hypothetical protein
MIHELSHELVFSSCKVAYCKLWGKKLPIHFLVCEEISYGANKGAWLKPRLLMPFYVFMMSSLLLPARTLIQSCGLKKKDPFFSVTHENVSFATDCRICAIFLTVLECAADAIETSVLELKFAHLRKRAQERTCSLLRANSAQMRKIERLGPEERYHEGKSLVYSKRTFLHKTRSSSSHFQTTYLYSMEVIYSSPCHSSNFAFRRNPR